MHTYAIMHQNRHVATIRGDGSCTVYYPGFMPCNLWLERAEAGDMDARMNNLNNFYAWCASRVLTLDRKYAKEILNSLGMKQVVTDKDRAEISFSYHALCLTDVYWVRELEESVTFAEINLYDHSLSDAFVDVSLRGQSLTAQNAELINKADSAGDLSTLGLAPKAWIRRDGKFWLLKDGDFKMCCYKSAFLMSIAALGNLLIEVLWALDNNHWRIKLANEEYQVYKAFQHLNILLSSRSYTNTCGKCARSVLTAETVCVSEKRHL